MKSIAVPKRQKSKAFTIIELAVVLTIVILTFMTVSPVALKMVEVAETKSTGNEMIGMQEGIDDFFKINARYPDSLEEIYGADIPIDTWGNPYQYLNHAKAKGKGKLRKDKNLVPINSDYDLYSMGPDGKTASALTAAISQDDVVRGRDGLFIGLASDY